MSKEKVKLELTGLEASVLGEVIGQVSKNLNWNDDDKVWEAEQSTWELALDISERKDLTYAMSKLDRARYIGAKKVEESGPRIIEMDVTYAGYPIRFSFDVDRLEDCALAVFEKVDTPDTLELAATCGGDHTWMILTHAAYTIRMNDDITDCDDVGAILKKCEPARLKVEKIENFEMMRLADFYVKPVEKGDGDA